MSSPFQATLSTAHSRSEDGQQPKASCGFFGSLISVSRRRQTCSHVNIAIFKVASDGEANLIGHLLAHEDLLRAAAPFAAKERACDGRTLALAVGSGGCLDEQRVRVGASPLAVIGAGATRLFLFGEPLALRAARADGARADREPRLELLLRQGNASGILADWQCRRRAAPRGCPTCRRYLGRTRQWNKGAFLRGVVPESTPAPSQR